MKLQRRSLMLGAAGLACATTLRRGFAQSGTPVRIGLSLPMTGPFASTGRAIETAARLYMQEHGAAVAGRPVELLVRDDTGVADVTRRIAQELIVREGVDVLAGFGLTPLALATAPLSEEARKLMVVMAAGTSIITERSPYITRTSFTLPQATVGIAEWAPANGIQRVVTLVSDYAPGHDAENAFEQLFEGEVLDKLRAPLQNPDFAPFLQRAGDLQPDALFVFVPSGVGAQLMKQFEERGLKAAGVRLIGTGDLTDDDILNEMGDVALDTVTSHHYSAANDSAENQRFVAGYRELSGGRRPNFMAVGGYDGMHLIYSALEATDGDADGDQLIEAVKGSSWISPRGPIAIDAETRDIIQDIYIHRVERLANGELYNVAFDRIEQVRDPVKAGLVQ